MKGGANSCTLSCPVKRGNDVSSFPLLSLLGSDSPAQTSVKERHMERESHMDRRKKKKEEKKGLK